MIANYHTHTHWCNHATGKARDYIKEAVQKGLSTIAITDHVPQRGDYDRYRMKWGEFDQFNCELDDAIYEYSDKIRIIKGFECEYYKESLADYEMFKNEYGYEIFVLGQHTIGDNKEYDSFFEKDEKLLLMYANDVAEAVSTGIFTFLAHPDLALNGYTGNGFDKYCERAMRIIFEACEKSNVPVEINANGLRKGLVYPSKEAFTISKDYKLRYLVNSDCHEPQFLADEYVEKAYNFAEKLGIKPMMEMDI